MESPGQEAAREDGGAAALRREICHINHRGNLLALIGVQAQIYRKFEKCNTKLSAFNDICAQSYDRASRTIGRHTRLLTEAKQDLEQIFKRIRIIKARLAEQYPETYGKVAREVSSAHPEEDDE